MGSSIRVLHVDDEPDFLDLTGEYLEREDDRLDVVTDTRAIDALDRIETESVDCVVSDYEMEGMDGLEFLDTLRQSHPDLPFILFTGKGSEEIASEAISHGVTDYLQKRSGAEQFDLLANRIVNAVESAEAERRAENLHRIRTIVRDINQALVRAADRESIETQVCDIVSDADPYNFALIADVDGERVAARTWAGVEADTLDDDPVPVGGGSRSPTARAVKDSELAVSEDVRELPADAPWRAVADAHEVRALAVAPLQYDTDLYGLLVVAADRPDAFDRRERELLEELAGDIAHAMHAVDIRGELEQYQTAVETVPEGVFIVDAKGEIQLINENGAAVIGYERAELLGAHVEQLVGDGVLHPAIVDWYGSALGDLLSSETDREKARLEAEIDPRDGDPTPVEINLSLRPYDEKFRGISGIIRDISDRREREQELAAQKAKVEALHEVATEIEATNSRRAVYVRVIEAAEEILEFDLAAVDIAEGDALVPKAVSTGIPEDGYYDRTPIDSDDNLAARAFRSGTSSVVDDIRTRDIAPAESTYLSALTVPMGEHGVFQAVSEDVAAFDETDREMTELLTTHAARRLSQIAQERELEQRAAELQRQNERLDEFASIVSHDLRTPLSIATGRLAMAREEHDSEHLQEAEAALDRMDALIEDTLTLARQGEAVGETERIELGSLVERCWETVTPRTADISLEGDMTFEAERQRLQQLLENLFHNAVEHGCADVNVTVGTLPEEDGFYVEDDGPGIPVDQREQVFEPGFTTSQDGTGFGLAIVGEIVDVHDWEVVATESSEGGARFEITGVDVLDE